MRGHTHRPVLSLAPLLRTSLLLNGLLLAGCASPPVLPDLQGQAAVVMGFTTDAATPYEGGTAYTGLLIHRINGASVGDTPLRKNDHRRVPPGKVVVEGQCYWYWRGISWETHQDLLEPARLEWDAQPGHIYTLFVTIDEYKATCILELFDKPQAAHD